MSGTNAARRRPGECLRALDRLAGELRAEGVTINLRAHLPSGMDGRFGYPDATEPWRPITIDIRPLRTRWITLLTFATLAGQYRAWKLGEPVRQEQGEYYGRFELQRVGFELSDRAWKTFHEGREP